MVREAAHDLGAVVEMTFTVAGEMAAGAVESDALAQADERVEQLPVPRSRAAHVAARDDGNTARRSEPRCAPPRPGLAAIEQMRDVDREALPEDRLRAVEQRGGQALVAAGEHTPMAGEFLELAPADLDAIARAGVAGLERLVAAAVGEGQQPA